MIEEVENAASLRLVVNMGRVDGWPRIAPNGYIWSRLVRVIRTYTCVAWVRTRVEDRFFGSVPDEINKVADDAAEASTADYERYEQGSELDFGHFPSLSCAGAAVGGTGFCPQKTCSSAGNFKASVRMPAC